MFHSTRESTFAASFQVLRCSAAHLVQINADCQPVRKWRRSLVRSASVIAAELHYTENLVRDNDIIWSGGDRVETSERIEEFENRLARLEEAVFSRRRRTESGSNESSSGTRRTGPSAGVRILIEHRFFESKRSLGDVRRALSGLGYYFSPQSIEIALKRMSLRDCALVLVRERGRNFYADRK